VLLCDEKSGQQVSFASLLALAGVMSRYSLATGYKKVKLAGVFVSMVDPTDLSSKIKLAQEKEYIPDQQLW